MNTTLNTAPAHVRVEFIDAETNKLVWSGTIAEMLDANGGDEETEHACVAIANGSTDDHRLGGGAQPVMILRRASEPGS